MRKSIVFAIASLVVLVAASVAVAATHKAHVQQASIVIKTRTVRGLGKILVNSKGQTLYMFVPDKHSKVTCVKACAAVWPPVKAAKGDKLVGVGGVKKALLGMDKNPAGGFVVTYAKWPLYTYLPDRKPGQVTGQGINSTGGLWYVMSPTGKVIKKKA